MVKNPKAKGNKAERQFSELLRDYGLDDTAKRNYSSGSGIQKSDVHNKLNYNIEVKHVEKLNIWKAIEQSQKDAEQTHTKPLIAFKKNRHDWWIVIPAWHWADLIRKSLEPKTQNPDKELLYLLENLKNVTSKIIKKLK